MIMNLYRVLTGVEIDGNTRGTRVLEKLRPPEG
jgi:hypothetical protein